ncbi:histidine phosphatase family protein [Nakamurella leprariae]|uniref:Histidine phosphatase family protein n=1 Tax=Nakamurella leprariae TaxID=2803911 RepID=A0A938YCL5_9ACTN|nr:histidine phosphatase family protein [Nakamurella leprariae]MBM9468167.1 histidine phosphatase family protein [Nakamurella leprariae]
MSELYLVRHGQSTWNERGLVQGQRTTPELTDLGRAQAAATAALLAGVGVHRVLSSDLTRAWQTAEIVARVTGLRPFASTLLRERGLGVLEGLTTQEAADRVGETDAGDPFWRPEGGESLDDVRARVAAVLASPLVTDLDGPVAVISHGDVLRVAIADLLGEDLAEMPWREVPSGAVFRVTHEPGEAIVRVETLLPPGLDGSLSGPARS